MLYESIIFQSTIVSCGGLVNVLHMLTEGLLSPFVLSYYCYYYHDQSFRPDLQAAAAEIAERYPQGIDMLLNNAGMQEPIGRAVNT